MSDKQEAIIAVATKLFSAHGYHAVGVDAIVAESGVAKMTFYKYFPSKDDLILKVLMRRDLDLRGSLIAAVDQARTPMGKLKAIFDWYHGWFRAPDFHGCMFIKASEEFPQLDSRAKLIAQGHKSWLVTLMEQLLGGMSVKSPRRLSVHIMVILDGLTVKMNMYDDSMADHVKTAWGYTKQLVKLSTTPGR